MISAEGDEIDELSAFMPGLPGHLPRQPVSLIAGIAIAAGIHGWVDFSGVVAGWIDPVTLSLESFWAMFFGWAFSLFGAGFPLWLANYLTVGVGVGIATVSQYLAYEKLSIRHILHGLLFGALWPLQLLLIAFLLATGGAQPGQGKGMWASCEALIYALVIVVLLFVT